MALTKVIGDGVGVLTTADEGKLKIQTGTTSASYLSFADGDNNRGYIKYDHNNDSLELGVAGESHFNINNAHILTMDKQPAFLATKSASQDNFAVGSGVTITFDTEVFDQNADFGSNVFTAPVTGRYQLSFHIRMTTLDSASGYYYIQLVTSNRSYISIVDPDFGQDNGHFTFSTSNLADMDANDTAYIIVVQQNGTQQTDFSADSYFSGFLAC